LKMRRLSSNRWCRGVSLRSAREGRSALFIMIKLKREIQISVSRSNLQLLFKLSLTPRASLVKPLRTLLRTSAAVPCLSCCSSAVQTFSRFEICAASYPFT
jgi:hypothetical protein